MSSQASKGLALTRRNGESIVIGGEGIPPIEVEVNRAKGGRARLVIRAPLSISIARRELLAGEPGNHRLTPPR